MKTINWGIIGCGNVTEHKSGPAFNLVEGSKLVAVMRRNAAKAIDYAKRHNVPTFYTCADDLINDPKVNAIYLATPPDTHAKYTIAALNAGKPVYVEKPMALNFQQCQEMMVASKKNKQALFVAYYRRTLPGFLKVKELIDSGAIGEVRLAIINLFQAPKDQDFESSKLPWRVKPEIAGGGYFFDLASHQLDFLDFLFGPARVVSAAAANQAQLYPAEDIVSATLTFDKGIFCSGNWCFSVSPKNEVDSFEIIGSKGKISFSTFNHTPIKLDTEKGIEIINYQNPKHIQYNLIKQVLDELLRKGKCVSTGESASRTNRVMDEIVKEYYNK
ncbi:Gfo/Idh/MocA family oxidoreductase [Desulfosarcina sp.]|nr:Gfo/Idh/MocA family oxidoreductase [Desulfosarcina sp.]